MEAGTPFQSSYEQIDLNLKSMQKLYVGLRDPLFGKLGLECLHLEFLEPGVSALPLSILRRYEFS